MKPETVFIFLVVLVSGCVYTSQTADATVEKVVDGDTVVMEIEDRREHVRLDGIDTPETNTEVKPFAFEGVSDTESGRECLRDHGENASSYVKKRISSRTVRIEYESSFLLGDRRGGYGRLLGKIFYRNRSLNMELVRKGLARSYTEEAPYFEEEVQAKLEERGVWNCQRVS